MPYRPWVYPPTYLPLLLPSRKLTFSASYFAFQLGGTLLAPALGWEADRPRSGPFVIGAALLCPAAAINVAVGQNAFLTAALLVGGLRALRRHRVLGGVVLAMLALKPQFGLLLPVALIAAKEWRALISSVVAVAALLGTSVAVFGIDAWRAVARSLGDELCRREQQMDGIRPDMG